MKRIYEVINEALSVWIEATGADPNEDALAGFWTGVYDANKDIQKAQELDPTGVTTFMVLRSSARRFAAKQTFDALQFLENPDVVLKDTAALRKLLALLNDKECLEEVEDFQASLRKMAKSYNVNKEVLDLIGDMQELAYVRRDAVLGYRELKAHRFAEGKRGTQKAKYNPSVLKFWNLNSAIRAGRVQPEDGVSLIMMRDPVAEFSCFAFLVRNGENIDILTDTPDVPHPLHKYMSRSKSRARGFESRAFRLRFPYDLFNFEFSGDGHFRREVPSTSLVRLKTEAVRVKPLRKLEPDETLWTLLMFDLIRERYWRLEPEKLPLSYTGESTLALPAAKTLGTIALPHTIALEPLTKGHIHRDSLKDNWERETTGQHDWMEDRYGGSVPEEVFNLVGHDKLKLLPDGRKITATLLPAEIRKEVNGKLIAVDPMAFGTPQEMERDRRFMARHNQAVVINAFAKAEFERREGEILKWYEGRVRENLPFLLGCVAKGTLISERQGSSPDGDSFDYGVPQQGEILTQWRSDNPREMRKPWYFVRATVNFFRIRNSSVYRCHLNDKPVSIWSHFRPMTPASLAVIAGRKIEELPDVLQHWTENDRYAGNSILDRIDPMEWKCKNPWREINFDVLIGLSKSGFNGLLKERGLPKREVKVPED